MLAQFGGVTLAFAFIATIGLNGVVTVWVLEQLGLDLPAAAGCTRLRGLILVYTYFQIPLMVIVFLPALDGLRPQWREAAVSLGGIDLAVLAAGRRCPCCARRSSARHCCCSPTRSAAYATAAALVSQGSPIVPLQIRTALTSEVVLGQAGSRNALALEMVVVVARGDGGLRLLVRADREVAAVNRVAGPRGAAAGLLVVAVLLPGPALRDGGLHAPAT